MEKKAILKEYAFSNFDDVKTIIFLDNAINAGHDVTDYSLNEDMSVVGWHDQNDPSILYVAPTIGNRIYVANKATSLFYDCQYLEEIKGIEILDTNETTDMATMFCGCRTLVSLDLSSFDTRNVTNMYGMFRKCHKLMDLNVSNFNTSKVKNMSYMFENCWCLSNIDLSSFNTKNVETMEHMFYCCDVLEELDISNFNFSSVVWINDIIKNCKKLIHINYHNMNYDDIQKMIADLNNRVFLPPPTLRTISRLINIDGLCQEKINPDVDLWSKICTHRDPTTGASTLIPDPDNKIYTCSVCKQTFRFADEKDSLIY